MAFLISKQCEILSPLLLAFIYRCLYMLCKTSQRIVLLLGACRAWLIQDQNLQQEWRDTALPGKTKKPS